MGWFGPCRDECGCDKTRDDFTGSSLDSGKWNEWDSSASCDHDGTFRIQSNRLNLYGDSSGDGLTINTVAATDMQASAAPSAQRAVATIKRSYTGHTYRLMVNWVQVDGGDYGDGDRYIYAEFVDSTGSDVTLKIGLGSCMASTTEYASATATLNYTLGNEMEFCLYVKDSGAAPGGTTIDDVITATLTPKTAAEWGGSAVSGISVSTSDYAALNDDDAGNARAGIGGKLTGSNYTTIDSDWFVEDFVFEVGAVDGEENANACNACSGSLSQCMFCSASGSIDALKVTIPSGSPAYDGTHILTQGTTMGSSMDSCCYEIEESDSCETSLTGCSPRSLLGIQACISPYQRPGTTQLWMRVSVRFLGGNGPFSYCPPGGNTYYTDFNTGETWSSTGADCAEILGGSGVSVPCVSTSGGGFDWGNGPSCNTCEGPATVVAI